MTELSERIRRNMTPNLDGWIKRLMSEAAAEIDKLHAAASWFITAHPDDELQRIKKGKLWHEGRSAKDAAEQIELRKVLRYRSEQ